MNPLAEIPMIPLWPDGPGDSIVGGAPETAEVGADGMLRISNIHDPAIYVFPAEKPDPSHPGLLVCPGGGYGIVSIEPEGEKIARRLNAAGIHVFVLKYRLAPYRHPVPLQDARQAMRLLRTAPGLPPLGKIGVMGFSAGGHLAATLLTQKADDADTATRPDFGVLGYPVISMVAECSHSGSRTNLLGPNPAQAQCEALSAELRVTPKTPPTFLFHAKDDTGVPFVNSLLFAEALERVGVAHEVFLMDSGGHGFGLRLDGWVAPMRAWLRQQGFLSSSGT